MDQFGAIRSPDVMTANIYSFLDHLLAAVRSSESLASEARERDTVSVPGDITPGGYPEDIFIFLSEREKEEYSCGVCYSVIKDVHQCSNGHKFCYSCIYVWSTCNRTGADCCPACRCDGIYARNELLNDKIGSKRVKCQDDGCNWRGFLRDYNEHEHRHYEFKELSRSIELPSIKGNEPLTVLSTQNVSSPKLVEDKNIIDNPPSLSMNVSVNNDTGVTSINRSNVNRTPTVSRRLPRPLDNSANTIRTSESRSNIHNYPRSTNISSRCPSYRHGTNYPPRPPRIARINRPTDITSANNHNEEIGGVNLNESTQTYSPDNFDEGPSNATVIPSYDSVREQFPRTPGSGRETHSPLFPAINPSSRNNLASSERQIMEYRRLAPTYASRRNNLGMMNDGREHLAMMLILLTSDLEDRPTPRSHSRDHLSSTPRVNTSLGASSDSNISLSLTQEQTTIHNDISRNSSRLQDFRNLNRRLSEVANSLDILIESTSRESDRLAASTARSSSGSPTSENVSDTEE